MLKDDEARFLDDLTLEEVSQKLNVFMYPVNGVEELIDIAGGRRQEAGGRRSKPVVQL